MMNKIKIYDIIATWFYSGYLTPASGTWGTLAALPLCIAVTYYFGIIGIIIGSCIIFFIGLWAADQYERETGKHDSSHIVIDEAAGMMIATLPLTLQFDWLTLLLCFICFRAFDAIKKGPVGWLDKNIHGALGVMIDDVAAGLLAAITVLGVIIWIL